MAASFRQEVYIGKPAELVWAAIIEKETIDCYYLVPLGEDSRPEVGATWNYGPPENVMIEGKVVEVSTQERFVHSFKFTFRDEPDSTVTYAIEPMEQMCKLVLTHDNFQPDSQTLADVSGGWPTILSELKTLLETGDRLPWPKSDQND